MPDVRSNAREMSIEEIAQIDLFVRTAGSGFLFDIDLLIISDEDPNSVVKFKNAVSRLMQLAEIEAEPNLKETWQNLFSKQVRSSVNRAKQKISPKS